MDQQGRKIVFFLGAGASLGAGAVANIQAGGKLPIPTQKDFWPTFLRFCQNSYDCRLIEDFLFRYFLGYHRFPGKMKPAWRRRLRLAGIDVEEVFTFLSERIRAPSTSKQLSVYASSVWGALMREMGHVFDRFVSNANTKRIYRQFLKNLFLSRDVVVSFNYDIVFETSLPAGEDWGYEGVEDYKHRLRILKPHGSINWALSEEGSIVRQASPTQCVVVAPTHLKFVADGDPRREDASGYLGQAPEIAAIWKSMEDHMKRAKALVFIGYSFPVADLYFSSVLRSVLATRKAPPQVIVVNPDAVAIAARLEARFPLAQLRQYFDIGQFVQVKRKNLLPDVI